MVPSLRAKTLTLLFATISPQRMATYGMFSLLPASELGVRLILETLSKSLLSQLPNPCWFILMNSTLIFPPPYLRSQRGLSLSCYYLLISPAPPPKICLPSQTSLACLDQLYQPTLKSPSLPKAPKAVLLLFKTDTNYGSLLINFR